MNRASAYMSIKLLAPGSWLLAGQRNISPMCKERPALKGRGTHFADR